LNKVLDLGVIGPDPEWRERELSRGMVLHLAEEATTTGYTVSDSVLRGGLNARGVIAQAFQHTTRTTVGALLKPSCAYVLVMDLGGDGHAVGVYVTHGWMAYDYYLFDPNFGELLTNSASNFNVHLISYLLEKHYEKPEASLRLTEVRLPSTGAVTSGAGRTLTL